MKEFLDGMADRIDRVLIDDGIRGRCSGGTVTHRFIRFDLETTDRRVLAMGEAFTKAIGRPSKVAIVNHGIVIEVSKEAAPLTLATLHKMIKRVPLLTAALGIDEDGRPLLLRIPAADVGNVLINGPGRPAHLLRTMIASLATYNEPANMGVALACRGQECEALATFPHLWGDRSTPARLLGQVASEISRRQRDSINHRAIMVAIDDISDAPADLVATIAKQGPGLGVYTLAVGNAEGFNVTLRATGEAGRFKLLHGGESIAFDAAWVAPQNATMKSVKQPDSLR